MLMQGKAPRVSYEVNGNAYDKPYYLADGIYPDWVTLVKTIRNPNPEKTRSFAKMKEACRKDVERGFGVLQARWAIVRLLSLSWISISALFVLFPLAGRGGEGWGRRTEDAGTPEKSRGSLSLVSWCDTGECPRSCDVKSIRWGMESYAPPAKPLFNKHRWLQRCALDILDIDLASRDGEEEDEDGDDGVVFGDHIVLSSYCSNHLCLPSPTRGRSVVIEGGLIDIEGAGESSFVWAFGSLEAISASFILTAACRLLTPVSSTSYQPPSEAYFQVSGRAQRRHCSKWFCPRGDARRRCS
ncbi:hypothetical protein QYE76_002314 [Lolium multiflorum]|uniref:Uncharacterized protein n=1 Tax=Lolium multiflorum TaxID=4521 RepID=A0AAD8RN38_LOLMU|nr:hypothetical protein QYE76_002314 [Lolium multiflorum]